MSVTVPAVGRGAALSGRSICLLSPLHLSANPRVLKEADALSAAGATVRVVTVASETLLAERDALITSSRAWRHEPIDGRRGVRWALRSAAQAWARRHPGTGRWGAARAASRHFDDLYRYGIAERSDLYIAHTLGALPAAWRCAERHASRLGYDAEDFESEIGVDAPAAAALRAIEASYLPRCDHVTAASDRIGAAYADATGIGPPVTIHNVFPWGHRDVPIDAADEREDCALSLYWYSQTVGPDRGLEDALQALAAVPCDVHLHLRGRWAHGYEQRFQGLASALGVGARVHHRALAPEHELVARAARHDVGLALEVLDTANRRLCLTNKLFAYLLAGIAVAATDTPAQRDVMREMPDAGRLYAPGDVGALARLIRHWREDPAALVAARAAALDAARHRWCWEIESPRLVTAVAAALAGGAPK